MTSYARIVKTFRFEAAHQLPNHDGACARLHGHSYTVEVGLAGPIEKREGLSGEGMVLDFALVSKAFRENIHDRCDHRFLNDVLPVSPTTAENIAGWILAEMRRALGSTVEFVRVWETATGYAEVRAW